MLDFLERIWTWRDTHRVFLPRPISWIMVALDWVLAGIYKTLEFLVFFKPLKIIAFLIFEFIRDVVWLIEWVIGLFCVFLSVCLKNLLWFLGGFSFGDDGTSLHERRKRRDFYH